jgi:hypothetical protein
VFVGGCLVLVATFAQAYPDVRSWAQLQFLNWQPVIASTTFRLGACGVILLYLTALIYTGSTRKPHTWTSRSLDGLERLIRGKSVADTLRTESLRFEVHPVTSTPIFLGLTARGSDEPRVTSATIQATNTSGNTLREIAGRIESLSTKQSFPLFLVCGGKLIETDQAFGVPPGDRFALSSSLSHRDEIGEGVPAGVFLENFGGFELFVEIDGLSCTFAISTDECVQQIDAFKRRGVSLAY